MEESVRKEEDEDAGSGVTMKRKIWMQGDKEQLAKIGLRERHRD
jgi:hypothetical protein